MASDNNMRLNLILRATDGMSEVIRNACRQSDKEFDKMNEALEKTADKFDSAGKKAALFGGALLGVSAANLKFAGDFEQGVNNISTIIDTNVESLSGIGEELLKIAKNSPKSIGDLTDGLYDIRSAGISAADQFNVLSGSEKLAVTGLSTTAEAVDIATSAINAFRIEGNEVNRMFDVMFKAVNYGKMSVSDFAQGFGSVAPIVSANKIAFDEYTAAVAAMTTTGTKAAIAHTQIKAAIAGLSRGSKEQIDLFNRLGVESFDSLIKKSGGMVNAFVRINKALNGNKTELIHVLGSIEAYSAVLALTGANNEVFNQTLNDMRSGNESISEAYVKQTAGLNNQISMIKNNFQALSIEFGMALLPAIKSAGGAIKTVTDAISAMPDGFKSFLASATAGIGVVSLLGGTSLIFIGSVIKNLIILRKAILAINIAAWANPAMLPVAAVAAAIMALAAGAVYCYKRFEGFRNMCQGLWAVIKAGGAWLAVLWQSFATGASEVWKFMKPAVQFGIEVFKWITPIGLVIQGIQKLCGWIGNLIEKAGGLRGIGSKISNWAADKQTKAESLNKEIKKNRSVDGSHAGGLDYVPYDGYIAETHRGEAILTEPEADRWRSSNTTYNTFSEYPETLKIEYKPAITIQGSLPQNLKDEFISLLKRHKEEIAGLIMEILKRREARTY